MNNWKVTIAEKYKPIIKRAIKYKMLEFFSVNDDYEKMKNLSQDVRGIITRIVRAIDNKYSLHPATKNALYYDRIDEWFDIEYALAEAEKITCTVCENKHNNKWEYHYIRKENNTIDVFRSWYVGDKVLPYCENCAETFIRRKAKEDYKVEKAAKEAREIGSLVRKIKQEIKSNGSKN